MKTISNSRLNREEQVQVVIRLKPDDNQNRSHKCVYLSQNQNQLVVQAGNKKEIFLFDSIAPQYSTQSDIYHMIGQEAVQASFEGYNCCIFAYGQTGAGKTYSVMGSIPDLSDNYLAESRGILPRIIEDIFCQKKNIESKKCIITCSYMQIYNQQIFDLLSPDKKIHQIRQDFKRGVFVQGLIQKKIYSYEQGINMLLEGEKTRKISSTAMNNESSRSHAIFTINIQSQVLEDQILKIRKSKLNIIDLAGSQRVKHTNVQGQRLKEGCSINKSLHVLGNVINSLVESTKKKKHIPFRDSKLTHFLKDSLGGNSITKLLANIHCGKAYFGDTLSTLMFAKRAKFLKLKVEVNQNLIENFDSLRKQVKRLRQELAQAKYFKDETQRTQRPSFQSYFDTNFDKILQNQNQAANSDALKIFQQNQLNYKALMQIYEQHAINCNLYNLNNKKKHFPMVNQWKIIQRKNIFLTNLLKRLPAFSKIYRQNLQLKQQLAKEQKQKNLLKHKQSKQQQTLNQTQSILQIVKQPLENNQIQEIIQYYQSLINQIKQNFQQYVKKLEKSYNSLEQQSKRKQQKLKDYIKRQGLQLGIEELKNQNEYLHLSILNLQNEISQFQENQQKLKQEHQQIQDGHHENILSMIGQQKYVHQQKEQLYRYLICQMQKIKRQAMKENQIVKNELQLMQKVIEYKDQEIKTLNEQIKNYKSKSRNNKNYGKSQSKIKRNPLQRSLSIQNINKSKNDLTIKRDQNQIYLPRLSFSNSIIALTQQKVKQPIHDINQNQTNLRIQTISLQLASLKEEKISKDLEINKLKGQIKNILQKNTLVQNELGKSLDDILNEYRKTSQKTTAKITKNIFKYKEQDPMSIKFEKLEDFVEKEKRIGTIDSRNNKNKEAKTKKEQNTQLKSNSNLMKKSMINMIK